MNTKAPQPPKDWEQLLASRWQRGKVLMITGYTYTIWERIQIRSKEEEPIALKLYVRGIGSKWQRAGCLKNKEGKWVFKPVRTSDAPEILTAILIKFLT